jgi:Family of unknown function (DUF6216)
MNLLFDVSTFVTTKPLWQTAAILIILIIALGWVFMRTQSTSPLHLLLLKILRIRVREEAVEVKSFVDNLSTLMIFRFLTKLKASSKYEADELICWANQKKVSLVQLQKCGKYFDLERRKILTNLFPSKAWLTLLGVVGFVFLSSLMSCLYLGAYNKAIINFTQSNTWVILDQTSAYEIKVLDRNQLLAKAGPKCVNSYVNIGDQRQPLTADEVNELCKSFGDPESIEFIRNTVLQQRVFAAYYGILSLIAAIAFFFVPVSRWNIAKKMAELVNKP